MANLKSHVNSDAPLSVKNLIVNRFSRHPERYFEIFGVLRKYELHHIAAQFMNHQHDDDEFSLEELRGEEEEDHAVGLASALEELGPCFIKLGQILSTRPDLLPANYIEALSRLQNTVTPVPGDKITAIIESELGAPISEFKLLTTPTVYSEYTTRRVLTLSFVHGRQLAEVSREELNSLDSRSIAKELLSAYLKQMVIDGVFHCDPHPGNIFLADDGRLALMDFGMVGRFDADQKDKIILLLLAFSERLGERVADTYLDMIEIPKDVDRRAFTQDVCALVSRYHDMSGGRMAIGTALLDLTRIAKAHSTPVPSVMTLLGKAMLNLDGTIRVLSPELDPVQLIRDYMINVMKKRVSGQLSPGRIFAWVLDMKHLFENTPRRADMIIDKLANDQLTVRLEVEHLDDAVQSLNRAANRLSISMVIASIIIGGSFVMETWQKMKGGKK